jgi:hypothetical protein
MRRCPWQGGIGVVIVINRQNDDVRERASLAIKRQDDGLGMIDVAGNAQYARFQGIPRWMKEMRIRT